MIVKGDPTDPEVIKSNLKADNQKKGEQMKDRGQFLAKTVEWHRDTARWLHESGATLSQHQTHANHLLCDILEELRKR